MSEGPDPRSDGEDTASATGREANDAFAPTTPSGSSHSPSDTRQIGPYRLLEKVGEGGMGVVHVAEQREPVRRKVALKVIKPGMDTKEVLARFEVEHHALTLMNHPSIARVLDAGATPEGRPYFVMEYVPGVTITDFCDRERLSTRERLELFAPICSAVQHAHQKGIIHRDLKPSNILVTLQDGKPVPKIIDFGVAKATAHRLTEQTLYTEMGQIIGTPEYMSPEQAEMSGIDIDTRSDVYSLGVILYELLVGVLPFDSKTLRSSGYAEIQRIIREVDPPKPSTRLNHLGEVTEVAATHRGSDTRTLTRRLRGDLDWITMKALEKNRARRYESASELAADLARHLAHEPVTAGPPGVTYRLKKFVRKNRVLVTAASVVLLALVAGMVATWTQYRRAENNAGVAQEERAEAVRQKERADIKATEATDERNRARELAAQMQSQYEEIIRLSDLKRLADARAAADDLWPAHPAQIVEMETWIEKQATPLRENLPKHRTTLEKLRAQAVPMTPAEAEEERRTHPRRPELEKTRGRLTYLERLLAVLENGGSPEEVRPDWNALPKTAGRLNEIAWPLVDPARTNFGREAEGLAYARRAAELSEEKEGPFLGTLAWASFANGQDAEAQQASATALERVPDAKKNEYQGYFDRLRTAIAERASESWRERTRSEIATLGTALMSLETTVNERRTWKFSDEESQWQHDTLAGLVADLENFVSEDPKAGPIASVEERLDFARSVEKRSMVGAAAAAAWQEATADIATLAAYKGLVLKPQTGLFPLGRDSHSGLWEFWHLQTGAKPEPNPDSEAVNSWRITGDTGLVLVLIPGGTFTMGAQKEDPRQPNHDPQADGNEGPPHEVTLAPFFLSKYELTQGQWERFVGKSPSAYGPDRKIGGKQLSLAHPVEQVSWLDCREVFDHLGLDFPTESQWEYAARAGTATVWWTGSEVALLQGAANVADLFCKKNGGPPSWQYQLEIDDGYVVHAPVGAYSPNAFGLHDVHGNVWEWCRDGYGSYGTPTRTRDGERIAASAARRVNRGGGFYLPAANARSAVRNGSAPEFRDYNVGARPAHGLH